MKEVKQATFYSIIADKVTNRKVGIRYLHEDQVRECLWTLLTWSRFHAKLWARPFSSGSGTTMSGQCYDGASIMARAKAWVQSAAWRDGNVCPLCSLSLGPLSSQPAISRNKKCGIIRGVDIQFISKMTALARESYRSIQYRTKGKESERLL